MDHSRYTALGLNHGREHSLLQAEKVDFVVWKRWNHHCTPYRTFWMDFHILTHLSYQWMGFTVLSPSLPHTWCPCCVTPRDCCHRRLIQQDVDAFPMGSVNWFKSPCGHVIANARMGARAGRKEEQDQHFGSSPQLNWIKYNMKLYPLKTHHIAVISFVTNTLYWQMKPAGIRMFLCSMDECNALLSTQDSTGSFWYIMWLMEKCDNSWNVTVKQCS